MTESQIMATITQIPVSELISLLTAISNRDYSQFEQLESRFADRYGIEAWEEYFNFRLLPVLDNASNNWLLEQMLVVV
ncbi:MULTISPECIES: hypothetical protein [Cyanophyceae]|uniref:hypothetical protein n=1 Tax=Cyanophyceae TaxID=3028117 RepID=UPI001689EE99|nr:hypothetical protein [Trichocoleus sp. FACHB-69]MBD1935609.1 hypothetical protein [Trichocoleus sp. FACHB-69]